MLFPLLFFAEKWWITNIARSVVENDIIFFKYIHKTKNTLIKPRENNKLKFFALRSSIKTITKTKFRNPIYGVFAMTQRTHCKIKKSPFEHCEVGFWHNVKMTLASLLELKRVVRAPYFKNTGILIPGRSWSLRKASSLGVWNSWHPLCSSSRMHGNCTSAKSCYFNTNHDKNACTWNSGKGLFREN